MEYPAALFCRTRLAILGLTNCLRRYQTIILLVPAVRASVCKRLLYQGLSSLGLPSSATRLTAPALTPQELQRRRLAFMLLPLERVIQSLTRFFPVIKCTMTLAT